MVWVRAGAGEPGDGWRRVEARGDGAARDNKAVELLLRVVVCPDIVVEFELCRWYSTRGSPVYFDDYKTFCLCFVFLHYLLKYRVSIANIRYNAGNGRGNFWLIMMLNEAYQ